jgi:hypothetical protein
VIETAGFEIHGTEIAIKIKVEKTCGMNVVEAPTHTTTGHI